MRLDTLHESGNEPPRPLWQLKSWEVYPEQLGARELEIRAKAQELADRNNELEGGISAVCEVLGVTRESRSIGEVELQPDPETGKRYSARIGRFPGGMAWAKYFEIGADGIPGERPILEEYHTSVFDVDDTTSLELQLRSGTFTWVNDRVDYDNTRPAILSVAESVITAWESTVDVLQQAMSNSELNPDVARLMEQKDAEEARRKEATAAFIADMAKN